MIAQWFKQFISLAAPYMTEISLGLIILLGIIYYVYYDLIKFSPIITSLKKLNQYLENLRANDDDNETILSKYFEGEKGTALYDAWQQYRKNTDANPDPAMFFNETSLIDVPTSRSKASSVSSLITTIGLMAAFLTLFSGIASNGFSFGDMDSIIQMLGGIILIVVVTVAVSSLYSYKDDQMYEMAYSRLFTLQQHLKCKLPGRSDSSFVERMTKSIDNLTDGLASYAQYTVDMQKSGMNQMVDSFLVSLNHEMNGALSSLGKTMEEFTASQASTCTQMEVLIDQLIKGTGNQQAVNTQTENILNAMAEYHQSIVKALSEYHDRISLSSKSLAGSLESLRQLSDSLSTIVSFNSDTMTDMKAERESLKNEYGKYIQSIKDQIEKYQKDSSGELERVMARFADVSGKTFDRLENSVIKSLDTWTVSNKSMLQNLEDQSKSLNSISREIALRLNELSAILDKSVKEFTEAVQAGTVNTLSEFDNGLGEITERLSITITEIRDSIDELPAAIQSLQQRVG